MQLKNGPATDGGYIKEPLALKHQSLCLRANGFSVYGLVLLLFLVLLLVADFHSYFGVVSLSFCSHICSYILSSKLILIQFPSVCLALCVCFTSFCLIVLIAYSFVL